VWRWILFYLVGVGVVAAASAPDAALAAIPGPLSRLLFGRVSRAAAAKIRPGMSLAEAEELVGTKAVLSGPHVTGVTASCRFAGPAGVIVTRTALGCIDDEAKFYPVGSPEYNRTMRDR
jgi:hypothetical protein